MSFAFSDVRLADLEGLLMARQSMKLSDFGATEDQDQFVDRLVDMFAEICPAFTIDALLVRPPARQATGYCDLPDDMILQAILDRRKHP